MYSKQQLLASLPDDQQRAAKGRNDRWRCYHCMRDHVGPITFIDAMDGDLSEFDGYTSGGLSYWCRECFATVRYPALGRLCA